MCDFISWDFVLGKTDLLSMIFGGLFFISVHLDNCPLGSCQMGNHPDALDPGYP